VRGPEGELIHRDEHIFGMAGAIIREADDLIASGKSLDLQAYAVYYPGEIAALTGREGGRPPDSQKTLADLRLDRIDPRRFYLYQYLAITWNGKWKLIDVEHIEAAIVIETLIKKVSRLMCRKIWPHA